MCKTIDDISTYKNEKIKTESNRIVKKNSVKCKPFDLHNYAETILIQITSVRIIQNNKPL